jgi:hypothetical protein
VAQVPVSELPLPVAARTQLLIVSAVQGAAGKTQVSVTCVHAPLAHEKEQAPV